MVKRPVRQTMQTGVAKAKRATKQATKKLSGAVDGASKAALTISALLGGLVLGVAGTAIVTAGQLVELEIILPNGVTANLKTSEGRVDLFEMIKKLFEDEMHANATKGVLEKRGIFELTSPALEQSIENITPDDNLSKRLREMLNNGVGPFNFQVHSFRNVRSVAVVGEFDQQAKEEYYDVVELIRQKCDFGEGFCAPRPKDGFLSVSSELVAGEGAACSTSRLIGSNVFVRNEQLNVQVVVNIGHRFFPCAETNGRTKDNYILVSQKDAGLLFGDAPIVDRQVKVYVAPPGYVPVIALPSQKIVGDPSSEIVAKF